MRTRIQTQSPQRYFSLPARSQWKIELVDGRARGGMFLTVQRQIHGFFLKSRETRDLVGLDAGGSGPLEQEKSEIRYMIVEGRSGDQSAERG